LCNKQANNSQFPGLTSRRKLYDGTNFGQNEYTSGIFGDYPQVRYRLMLEANLFGGETPISPVDGGGQVWTSDKAQATNYSYAMMDLTDNGQEASDENGKGLNARVTEWSETINTEAPVMTDRNTGNDTVDNNSDDNGVSSLHTDLNSGDWKGSVVYNDNHVNFEPTHILGTRLKGGESVRTDTGLGNDNLFGRLDAPNASSVGEELSDGDLGAGNNAAMVYHDATSLTSHTASGNNID